MVSNEEKKKKIFKTEINKFYFLAITGSILFTIAAAINLSNKTIQYLRAVNWFFDYIFAAVIALSLIPIALSFGGIAELYFKDHVRKEGIQGRTYLLIYAIGEILKPFTIGSVVFGSLAILISLASRAMGFRKIDLMLTRIKKITEIKVGSIVYQIFGFYSIIVSVIASIANAAGDEEFLIYLLVFNGTIETILMIMIGVKIIVDVTIIKRYIKRKKIKPRYMRIYGTIREK